jgi:hypothetical protein
MSHERTLVALAAATVCALAPCALQAVSSITAAFTAPAAGQTLSGNIYQSKACEVIGSNIRRVSFSLVSSSGVVTALNNEFYAPWNCNLDTRKFSDGAYTLRAVAYDAANASLTLQRNVIISNGTPPPPPPANPPPVVSIVQPANGASVPSGAISCMVNATDADGIRQVDWYVDGGLVHTDLQAPYDTCNISNLAAGAHTIRAVATDTRGATAAAQVTVNAAGAAPPPPPTAGCSIGSTAAIAVSAVPSRVSGIAPLSVFFDATGTAAAATSRPYHDLEYRWSFGDPAGGAAWSQGSSLGIGTNSKNSAMGPVAAHVFEAPGTYNVCLRVTDGANTADRAVAITVTAPDSAAEFSGRNTLCVNSGAAPVAGVDGCPIGAAVLHSGDFDAAINTTARNGATHRRILFRRGGTFSTSTAAVINVNGPGLVGAYGATGAKPLVIGNSAKMLFGNPSNLAFADWRVMDLSFDGQNQSSSGGTAFETIGPFRQLTLLRVEARRALHGMLLSKWFLDTQVNGSTPFRAPLWSELALVDSVIEDVYGYGFLGEANRLSMMGNRFHARTNLSAPQDPLSHLVRIGYTNSAVVSHNRLAGGSPGNSLTIRGVNYAGDRTIPAGAWTEKALVSDNVIMGGNSVWFFTIYPVNNTYDTRFRNILIERNSLVATPPTQHMLVTDAGELTVRNNLFNLTGAAGQTAIFMSRGGVAPAGLNLNASLYNNTAYSGSARNGNFRFLEIANGAPPSLRVRNNLSYAPNLVGSHLAVSGTPGAGAVISHNTDGAAIRSGNFGFSYAGGLAEPEAWRANGPDVVDRGTPVPVWSDFFLIPRGGVYDLGAINPMPQP